MDLMKRLLTSLIFFLTLLVLPVGVSAQGGPNEANDVSTAEVSSTPKPKPGQVWKENRAEVKELRSEIKTQVQELKQNRQQLKQQLTEAKKYRVRTYHGRLKARFEAAIKRLNTLSERILARLDILAEGGEDVSSLKTSVSQAQGIIDNAESLLPDLETLINEMAEAENPKDYLPTVKDAATKIKDSLKEAHSILVQVVTEIKGLRVGATENE